MNDTPNASRARRNGLIAWLLLAGLVLGLGLVALADDGADTPGAGVQVDEANEEEGLALDDLSQDGVAELARLAIPDDATGFLTATLDGGRQLDVAFTIDATQVDAFVAGSGLPEPEDDVRVVTHSSPLWSLNPDDTVEVRGATDVSGEVRRSVELLDTGDGSVEVHAVLIRAV